MILIVCYYHKINEILINKFNLFCVITVIRYTMSNTTKLQAKKTLSLKI